MNLGGKAEFKIFPFLSLVLLVVSDTQLLGNRAAEELFSDIGLSLLIVQATSGPNPNIAESFALLLTTELSLHPIISHDFLLFSCHSN